MKTGQATGQATYPREGLAKVTDAAAFLSVGLTSVYAMIKDGELKPVMIRGDMRVSWESLHRIASGK